MESESLGEEIYSPEGKEVVEALIYVGVLVSREKEKKEDEILNDESFYVYALSKAPTSVLQTLSRSQLKEARTVRQVLRNLGYKSNESIRNLVKNGFLSNIPVAPSIFAKVDELLGRAKEVVEGKTRRVKDEISTHHLSLKEGELVLEWDLMFMWGHSFLVSVTVPLSHCYIVHLGCKGGDQGYKDFDALQSAAAETIAYYRSKRWKPVRVVYDGEKAFSSGDFDTWIRGRGVIPNPLASGRHASRVERKIGHLKTRMLTVKSGLPYSLPPDRVPQLVKAVVVQVNVDCCKANVQSCPPQILIDRIETIDYNHWHGAAFGDWCQVSLDRPGALSKGAAKTVDGIAMYPDESTGRGWWFWIPATNQLMPRKHFVQNETYSESVLRSIHTRYTMSMHKAVRSTTNASDTSLLSDLRADGIRDNGIALSIDKERLPSEDFVFAIQQENSPYTVEDLFEDTADRVEYEALLFATQYSMSKGVKIFGKECTKATRDELSGIIEREVMLGARYNDLSPTQKKKIIRAKMIITEKFKDGIFERLKARLVALGNLQDKSEYGKGELSTPTPSHTVLLLQMTLAAIQRKKVYSFDIGQAFLNAEMSKRDIHIRLSADIAKLMVEIDNKYKEFVCDDGTMIVKLDKALYGIVEAPKLWYDTFCSFLQVEGFQRSDLDPCYFFKRLDNGEMIDLTVHVDDGLLTCKNEKAMVDLLEKIEKRFKIVKVVKGNTHFHLGMQIVFRDGKVDLSMASMASKIVEVWGVNDNISDTPHDDNLFRIDNKADKLPVDIKEKFHSSVQSCLYLSIKTRPDITCAVNFLTTRVREPNQDDLKKLMKLITYINGTKEMGITLGGDENGKLKLTAFADASYGVHADGKSHTGIYISLGLGPLMWKSIKQRCVTKSSCEAEIIALSDIVSLCIWIRDMLTEIGEYEQDEPVVIMEDNKAAITLIENGASTSERSKHIHIRNCFIRQFVVSGDFKLQYCPTTEMIADIFTKPLQRRLYSYLRDYLLGKRHWSIT